MSEVLDKPPEVKAIIPFFTKENAAIYQKLSVASRKGENAIAKVEDNEANEAEKFRIKRLVRVREELDSLDKMMANSTDAKEKFALANASSKLQEQEGWLANRAKPGNLKPTTPKAPKSRQSAPEPEDSTS